jgi:hypothetical protein
MDVNRIALAIAVETDFSYRGVLPSNPGKKGLSMVMRNRNPPLKGA